MPASKNITHVIKKSCSQIENAVAEKEKRGVKTAELIRDAIGTFFDELKKSGFSMNLDEFIESKMAKSTQKCLDIAKESVDSFKVSNTRLQDITESHAIEIEQITDDANEINLHAFRNRFDAFQKDLLVELERANEIIHSLEREIEELQKQSNIDPLTKLFNRKALEIDGHKFLEHGNDRNLDLVALMIDADDFKKVNDTFGHVAGDKVLILLAKLFKSAIREYDRAYRYGGEEFLILFNRAKKEDGIRVANRIMQLVRRNKIVYKDQEIRITLSMGLTEHRRGDTLETLIERADAAVYEAKHSGKDKLVVR